MAKKNTSPLRTDGWQNLISSMGVSGRDATTATRVRRVRLRPRYLEDLYSYDDAAKRMIDLPIQEMLRPGWSIESEDDPELAREVHDAVDAKIVQIEELETFARIYGGAAMLLGADDGGAPDTPLVPERIRSFDWVSVLQAEEIYVDRVYADPFEPRFGQPELYRISGTSDLAGAGTVTTPVTSLQQQVVHASRIIALDGVWAPRYERARRNGWGLSALEPPYQVLQQFHTAFGAAASLLPDFSVAVFKMVGLREALASDDAALVKARMETMSYAASTINAYLLDAQSDESFERKSTPVTGMPELLDRLTNRFAAAAKMPVSLLMGQEPAGLNSSGTAPLQYWYNSLESDRAKRLGPVFRRLTDLEYAMRRRADVERQVKFGSMWSPSDKERSETELNYARADDIYWASGAVTSEQLMEERLARRMRS